LWGGFVDGAIESGLRESRRVIAALKPHRNATGQGELS
jgi:monoamine oxidase